MGLDLGSRVKGLGSSRVEGSAVLHSRCRLVCAREVAWFPMGAT